MWKKSDDDDKLELLIKQLSREISEELHQKLMNIVEDTKRRKARECYERRTHLDNRSLYNYQIMVQAITETLEETFIYQEQVESFNKILSRCTQTQRRRFTLHFVYGYSYEQIAKIEKRHVSTIQKSVQIVLKKIEKELMR